MLAKIVGDGAIRQHSGDGKWFERRLELPVREPLTFQHHAMLDAPLLYIAQRHAHIVQSSLSLQESTPADVHCTQVLRVGRLLD